MKQAQVSFYGEDLALIHDLGFGDFSERAAPFLLRLLRDHGIRRGSVLDIGCGSGQWLSRLSSAGHRAIGIDRSHAMIERARSRAPQADLRVADVRRIRQLPRCDAITALGEVLCYVPSPRSPDSLARFVEKAHAALRPKGLLIFDLAGPGRVPGGGRHVRGGAGSWSYESASRESPDGRFLSRDITTRVRDGTRERRGREIHTQRLYAPRDVLAILRATAFRARHFRGYGALHFAPGHHAYVAVKRG
jgi:SAM-dependent methyltransferase